MTAYSLLATGAGIGFAIGMLLSVVFRTRANRATLAVTARFWPEWTARKRSEIYAWERAFEDLEG